MQKVIIFTAYNGTEIIDPRPEAEIVRENQKYYEQRFTENLNRNKHPFAKVLAHACGLL